MRESFDPRRIVTTFFLAAALAVLPGRAVAQQTRVITGKVVDATSAQPIGSVQISVVGTQLGTIGETDGTFRLRVPAGDVRLVFRLIGYRRKVVSVPEGQSSVQVTLTQDVLGMEEIVVSGRATGVEKRNLANAVSTLTSDQLVKDAPAASTMEDALHGKVAGAKVSSFSGAPGGGMSIELRGVSSIIGTSQPLYVVDGVVVSNAQLPSGQAGLVRAADRGPQEHEDNSANRISDLNPDDIESIQILKGPSAAAIYGAAASNGVVLITTKHGQFGASSRWHLTQSAGVPSIANKVGLRKFGSQAAAVDAFGPDAATYWKQGAFFDHEQELAGNKPLSFETNVSVAGGLDNTSYYLSGLGKYDGGIVTNTGYEKESARLNLGKKFGSLGQLSVNTNYVRAKTSRGLTNNDNYSISYWMAMPSAPSFVDLRPNADGSFPDNPFSRSNPLQTAALVDQYELVNRFIGSSSLDLTPITNDKQTLQVKLTGGLDWFAHTGKLYSPPDLQYEQTLGQPGTSSNADGTSLFTNAGLSAIHTLYMGDVQATTSAGAEYQRRDADNVLNTANNLIDGLSNVDKGTNTSVTEYRSRTEDFGFYGQEEVLISQKLLVTAGIRGDQSSGDADPTKIFWYPKASASYRITGLPDPFAEIKVRAAYGQSGNEPEFGQKFSLLSGANYNGLQSLTISGSTAASDLRPEKQTEYEGGLDFTFRNERAQLSVTVYQQDISDLLVQRNLPGSTGYSLLYFNGGSMRQRGLEAALTAVPVKGRSFNWSTRTTFSMNRSKITELTVPPFRPPNNFGGLGSYRIEQGFDPTAWVGNDTTSNGSIEQNVRLGRSRPSFQVGFSNDIRWKDITFHALLDWEQGFRVANLTGWLFDLSKNRWDYANPCNDPACQPGETLGEMRLRLYPSKSTLIWLEDASFLKLRELSLSWNVPTALLQSIWRQFRSARLTLSGRDLLRFTGYSGMDPEVTDWGLESISTGQDVAPYPPSRSVWLTLDLSF
ncbi:MAG: SusC/RagA family TonB-linked outer membrane protein [Candidatus Palauibacterales bacterium]|nr:SusC/RagA family TonB-linked outer membrane protein [Candidatus Palauibacterales bacterium]MDP2530257.1 SusC/RagA family TonB-linked outer membrane protein [Candidatus Palauibacterales bacterium]MDP2583042.1 SusC/RagA family TonB-linked outer membrane protein [Candidatus Palauibacterales bacterium]